MDQPRMITYKTKDGQIRESLLGIPNYLKVPLGTSDPEQYYPSHLATDFYHHYQEDIALFCRDGL